MRDQLENRRYAISERAYGTEQITAIKAAIAEAGIERAFGVREFLHRAPRVVPLIFTDVLRELLHGLLPGGARVIRSIYFDKPPDANWIVNWHQDLTVNLTHREDHPALRSGVA